jgi:hypothetical protein
MRPGHATGNPEVPLGILTPERTVVVYGNLAAAALRTKTESEYVIYAIARAMLQNPGSCSVAEANLIVALGELGVYRSRPHIQQLLERGHGVFWHRCARRVWLRVRGRLHSPSMQRGANAHRHGVMISKLGSRAGRRGELLAAWLPTGKPITQRAIQTQTGVTDRTQRRYRHRGHFGAMRNVADLTAAAVASTPALRRLWAQQERHHGVYTQGPEAQLKKRLPNSYSVQAPRISRGRRSRDMFAAQALYAVAEGSRTALRVFFDTAPQWVRCRTLKLGTEGGEEHGYPFNLAYLRTGRQSWEAIAC